MGRKTDADPTGQAKNRRKARIALTKRLNTSQKEVLRLLANIPRQHKSVKKVVNQIVYEYDIDALQLSQIAAEIRSILNINLETSADQMPLDWFFKHRIEPPFREGAAEDMRDINKLINEAEKAGFIEPTLVQQQLTLLGVVNSPTYRKALQIEYVKNYEIIKTLSQDVAKQVFVQLRLGVEAGENPRKIASDIRQRFDVSRTNAERISRTEINAAYNNSKLTMTNAANDDLFGQPLIANMHISALRPTTRDDHAARHGLTYSTADQMQWWNTGSNRINCLCSTQKVVVDPKTGKVFNTQLQEETRQKGLDYFKSEEAA